ncbi:SCP2 sterol-binding domain-containing protein [Oxalobacteraceae bacterium R-40]|uniref:Ubiquinone biosynthesis accessory factor UbiJ n=1 Tax=Keguizhuia sedimenti TaxID=3064264 RepID=A0ABU1BIX7_9BURK|nr:SCP2 sterol-binding domain-containing protein [Oxalobacteraceae bacterium R-40]
MIFKFAPAAINHLLNNEPKAKAKIAAHAGKVALFDLGVMTLRLKAGSDGFVEAAADDQSPQVTIHVKPADLPLIAQHRDRAFSYVKIDGDADFANAISQVSQAVQWDAEKDLSKLVGDIAAVRLVAGGRAAIDGIRSTQQKIAENFAEYFLEENPMLMRPRAVSDFSSEVSKLRDDVERLSKRIDKLKGSSLT